MQLLSHIDLFFNKAFPQYRIMYPNSQNNVLHYWNQINNSRKRPQPAHYDEENLTTYYGHNRQKFFFPLCRDQLLKVKNEQKNNGTLSFPDSFIPEYQNNKFCPHNMLYDADNQNLVLLHQTVTIFSKTKEEILNKPLFGRKSLCIHRCVDQPDLHSFMLWNCGGGVLLDYHFLIETLIQFGNCIDLNAQFNSRNETFAQTVGFSSSLTLPVWERNVIGKQNMKLALTL